MSYTFQLLQALQPHRAIFSFHSQFEGQTIIWQAELLTLSHYHARGVEIGLYRSGHTVKLQQFIEIGEQQQSPQPIRIVHAISQIDEASVLKTVIMVSNYKRLQRGRHAYGDYYEFTA